MRLLLLLVVLLTACGDTGTRHKSEGLRIGQYNVIAWPGATPAEKTQIRETVTLHVRLLNQYAPRGPLTDIVFVEFARDLNPIRNAINISNGNMGGPVLILSQIQAAGLGEAMIDTYRGRQIIYIYAGPKIEGLELGHAMMHTIIGDLPHTVVRTAPNSVVVPNNRGGHTDLRWPLFLVDDWLLSLQIAQTR